MTFACTVRALAEVIRRRTVGGLPETTVRGTSSTLTTGGAPAELTARYSLPPAFCADGCGAATAAGEPPVDIAALAVLDAQEPAGSATHAHAVASAAPRARGKHLMPTYRQLWRDAIGLGALELFGERGVREAQALRDRHLRVPAELALGERRVEAAALELTRPQVEQLGLDVLDRTGDRGSVLLGRDDELAPNRQDVRLASGRDVVCARSPRRREQRSDDVGDVYVVACGLAVSIDPRRLALVQVVAEDRDDPRLAVRALPRAVDVSEPADR